ncbi:SpaA isopeptide-forming pilin-related protein, partial [Anaerobacillus sp. 1_MG-2023]|uniref:prealbumin-like fold domain-containing protein n=1 Tax=Anaerobacillus sp. 1_MG-2023 TaxID=3062655 RepID=UPI0026E1F0A3
ESNTVTIKNDIITGSVKLTKLDSVDSSERLEGAVYSIKDSSDNVVKTNVTTNSSGEVVVNNLRPGNYTFVETKAPFGYV